jgi:hypothetical protein
MCVNCNSNSEYLICNKCLKIPKTCFIIRNEIEKWHMVVDEMTLLISLNNKTIPKYFYKHYKKLGYKVLFYRKYLNCDWEKKEVL